MDQPIPTPPEQLLAALDTARHMAGHIAPDDLPPGGAEQSIPLAFAAGGFPEVIGVVLRGIPTLDALERIKTTFGGSLTVTRRASSASGTQWTEHQLVGMVRGVPYLAEARTDHQPLLPPLPRRERGATVRPPAPDMVLLDVVPQQGTAEHDQADRDDGTRTALVVVDASRAWPVAPDLLGLAHEVLHPEPGPEALAGLLAHTDTQAGDDQ